MVSKDSTGSSIRQRFITNSAWLMFEQVFRLLLGVITSVLTARYLGPANLGIVTYIQTIINAVLPVASLSMEQIIIKDLVGNPDKTEKIVGSGILLRIISGFFCFLFVVLLVAIQNPHDSFHANAAILGAISLVFHSLFLIETWLQAHLRSKLSTIIKSIGYAIMSGYKVFLLSTGKGVVWFSFAISLDAIIIGILFLWLYSKANRKKLLLDIHEMKRIVKESFPLIVASLAVVLYGSIDRMILRSYHGDEALGIFGVGATICYMWQFIPAALITSSRPVILKMRDANYEIYLKRLKQLYASIWWLSVFVSLGFLLLGDFVVNLMYGEAYAGSGLVVKVLAWSQGFSLIGGARSIWLLAEGKTKYLMISQVLSAGFAIILSYLLVPAYGVIGASVSVLITQLFVALLSTLFHKETRQSSTIIIQAILLKGIR